MGLVDLLNDSEYMNLYVRIMRAKHRAIPQKLFKTLPKPVLERLRREWMKPKKLNLNTKNM